MLGINSLVLSSDVVRLVCKVDAFQGYWSALEGHTTGLNLLSEFAKHGQAFKSVLDGLSDQAITPAHVRALYQGMVVKSADAVSYRTRDEQIETIVNVRGTPVGFFDLAPAGQIDGLLGQLTEWMDETLGQDDLHPVIAVSAFHAIFMQIGPFSEGNQKICNILTQIYLFKAGYSYAPYVPLERLVTAHAGDYYRGLKALQASLEVGQPDWRAWLSVFIPVLQGQARLLRGKINDEVKDLSHLPALSAQIMAQFEGAQRLKMKELIQLTQTPRATLKLRLNELIDGGYLKRHGGGRSTWYSLV